MTTMSWDELIKNSAGSFDPVPNGDYDVLCVEASAAQTQNAKAMVKAKFRIQGGPHDGRHLWNQFVISPENPNALSFFFQHMKVFGMDENFFAQLPPVNAHLGADDPSLQRIAASMLNRPARVTVNIREWNGQKRNNITALKAPLGPIGSNVSAPQVAAPGVPAPQPAATPQPAPPVAQPPAPAPQAPVPQAPPAAAPPAPQPVSPPAPAQPVQPQVIGPPPEAPPAPQPMQPPAPSEPPQELAF